MLEFYLATLLAACVLALPPRIDDGLFTPSVEDDDIVFFNQTTAPWEGHTICYPKTDELFFSLMSSPFYNFDSCRRELRIFGQQFEQFDRDQITFWYTSDHSPPSILPQPALQLPVFHRSPVCSFAITSPKMLNKFATDHNILWRRPWGSRTEPAISYETAKATQTDVLLDRGLIATLDCVFRDREAGFRRIGE